MSLTILSLFNICTIVQGANIDSADKHGISPLLAAIWEGHTSCVKFLVEKVSNQLTDLASCSPFDILGSVQVGHSTRWLFICGGGREGGDQSSAEIIQQKSDVGLLSLPSFVILLLPKILISSSDARIFDWSRIL